MYEIHGSVKSEVRILGTESEQGIVLLTLTKSLFSIPPHTTCTTYFPLYCVALP